MQVAPKTNIDTVFFKAPKVMPMCTIQSIRISSGLVLSKCHVPPNTLGPGPLARAFLLTPPGLGLSRLGPEVRPHPLLPLPFSA